jgi:hypothetical protein
MVVDHNRYDSSIDFLFPVELIGLFADTFTKCRGGLSTNLETLSIV